MNDYRFGNFLCMLREKNGMTQADIASKLGVTPAAVSKWENGSSKPRVEVLFQLAQLLGVRAEELMCGHYIPVETMDPEAVRQINERYTYLIRVDAYNTASVKWRRLLAWIIDWNIIGFAVFTLVAILSVVTASVSKMDTPGTALIILFIILMYPICFILRDLIFGGRSPGKRMLGLIVLDKETGMRANAGKCALRNIFLFVLQIDAIVMLVSGTTLGDRAAHTVVVQEKTLYHADYIHKIAEINKYDAPKKVNTKRAIGIVVITVVCVIVLLVFALQIALSVSRNTEEYRVAYNYFVESQTFDELNADEQSIQHNRYSRNTRTNADGDTVTQTAEIGFTVKGKPFVVICHKQDGVWIVCEECTTFH